MASRVLVPAARGLLSASRAAPARGFQTARALRQEVVQPVAAPVKRPVGAFRGGLFGFLTGATAATGAMYYYVIDEYRVANELLTEDIYALQAAVQRIEGYVKTLEDKLDAKPKK